MKLTKLLAFCLCMSIPLSVAGCNTSRIENTSDSNIPSSYAKSSSNPDASTPKAESVSGASSASIESDLSSSVSNSKVKDDVGSWVKKASMNTPRYNFGAVTVNGKIYVLGGLTANKNQATSSAEVYDSKSNKWTKVKAMSVPRAGLTAVVLNNEIYVFGGFDHARDNQDVVAATAEKYNPSNDQWIALKPMSADKQGHPFKLTGKDGYVLNGKIYIIGSFSSNGGFATVEMYDPKSDQWTVKASLQTPRMDFETVEIDGIIYVLGGQNSNGDSINSVEMYDTKSNQWAKKSPMETARRGFRAETVNGRIYVIGGVTNGDDIGDHDYLSSVEEYNPDTDKWTTKKPMDYKKSYFQTVVLNGNILAIGGMEHLKYSDQAGGGYLSSVEEYDPKTGSWTKKSPLLTGRTEFQTEVIGNNIYAIGGTVGLDAEGVSESGTASLEEHTATE